MKHCANCTLRFIVLQNNTYLIFLLGFNFNIFIEKLEYYHTKYYILFLMNYFIPNIKTKKYRDKALR